MVEKKTTIGQTPARMVMDILRKCYAFTPNTTIGHDVFKNLRLSTSVITYTIANLMETDIIMKTDNNRYYSVGKNWNKIVHKVNLAYVVLPGFPIIILLIFLGTQMLVSR